MRQGAMRVKIKCSISQRQYASIKEDMAYLESETDKKILQPDTCRFLKQAVLRAEIKLARLDDKRRTSSDLHEKSSAGKGELCYDRTI
jgi:hypothetical protein